MKMIALIINDSSMFIKGSLFSFFKIIFRLRAVKTFRPQPVLCFATSLSLRRQYTVYLKSLRTLHGGSLKTQAQSDEMVGNLNKYS